MRALLCLVVLLAGCVTAAPDVAQNGPVTIVLDSSRNTARVCAGLTKQPSALGCIVRMGETATIFCPRNDETCLAHEIRHAMEPGWNHE